MVPTTRCPIAPWLAAACALLAGFACQSRRSSSEGARGNARAAMVSMTPEPVLESRPEPPARRRLEPGQVMGGAFKRLKQQIAAQTAGLNAFSLALYRQVPPDPQGNRFLSPWSVSSCLHLALLGARGDTAQEMRLALRSTLPGLAPHSSMRLLNLRVLRAGGSPGARLRLANRAWAAERYPLRPQYVTQLKRLHGADLGRLDFDKKNADALRTINGWISKQTQGKIPKLIDTLAPDTRLVLTNAVYFLGQWLSRFPPAATRPEPFQGFKGPIKAPLMRQTGTFRYAETEGVKLVALPYQGKLFSMLAILPAPGQAAFDALEKSLDTARLTRLRTALQPTRVQVVLPRFRLRARAQLRPALQALGMKRAFTRQADFSGIADAKEPFWIDQVIHEAYVDVNEKGTEAAAATAITMRGGGAPTPPPEFRADRPFLFLILHEKTGAILFLGRVSTPVTAK